MTLADTVAYKKQIEAKYEVDLNKFEEDIKKAKKKAYDEMQDEIKKQTKEGSSYFTKENLLYAAAGAVIVGGVACALYPPCALLVCAVAVWCRCAFFLSCVV